MVHNSCCVVECKNTGRNSNCKFYTFPSASWKLEQRRKWINAVKRIKIDGSPWTPKPTDTICSDHFVGGVKGEEETSPSYIPTIFPSIYNKPTINEETSSNRHARFLKRRFAKNNIADSGVVTNTEKLKKNKNLAVSEVVTNTDINQMIIDYTMDFTNVPIEKIDKDCQVDFLSNSNEAEKTFICNRYIYLNADKCDVEIQTC
ncbi:THAP domain-containing protein 5-like [Polistes fuscatus]|uniref:THAP domain-containing protein 5-like n=1 Tax=Polistes fuscatus TaxID=30207 RepID=UPI001CA7F5F2|nr:THAP domain-containing protein 5-like [Polistes fuscatus]